MTITKPIRVAVASEQAIYRRGLASLLMTRAGIQLVGEAESAEEAYQLIQLVQPDIILIDLKSPSQVCEEVVGEMHARWPLLKIILFLDPIEEGSVPCDPSRGVASCFSKDISETEFLDALQQISASAIKDPRESASLSVPARADPESRGRSGRALPPIPHAGSPPGSVHAVPAIPSPMNYSQIQARLEEGESLSREMVMAGKIQADILPERIPVISGWDISARLVSARETSGDFYDFIPLANNNWGIVVADVTDKGMGAALFMALSSTLLRTYAGRYPSLPALTLDAVNERILTDTRGNMFVTAFYCVLEPHIGRLRYVNAGHPPGVLVSVQRGKPVDLLRPTGMALGVSDEVHWQQKIARLTLGDVLLLYTDGITEAQSRRGAFYGQQRMVDIVRRNRAKPASQIQAALLEDVYDFVGSSGPQDDIALIVVKPQTP
jgi:serine phosphatase RsbU (regulator of sigma subunit)/DNA-binding NarL/FixJ family response regulator